ncbi:MAG TPA: sporulation protein YtfJ [Firmicutes bacterium]|nr:sporulation protein YtfJ [Bacillota bacterium]
MEGEHPIQGLMKTAMESIRDMVNVNTVVGDAVQAEDGTVIIPVSKVSFGFAAGGGEYETSRGEQSPGASGSLPFAGGSGAGVSVQPMGFLVAGKGHVRLLSIEEGQLLDKAIDLAPQIVSQISSMIRNRGKGPQTKEQETPMQGNSEA